MKELVEYLVTELVENKDAVVISEDGDTVSVSVDKKDMGKIIGRGGKIAKAIRTIVKAAGAKEGRKYTVDILEADDGQNGETAIFDEE